MLGLWTQSRDVGGQGQGEALLRSGSVKRRQGTAAVAGSRRWWWGRGVGWEGGVRRAETLDVFENNLETIAFWYLCFLGGHERWW